MKTLIQILLTSALLIACSSANPNGSTTATTPEQTPSNNQPLGSASVHALPDYGNGSVVVTLDSSALSPIELAALAGKDLKFTLLYARLNSSISPNPGPNVPAPTSQAVFALDKTVRLGESVTLENIPLHVPLRFELNQALERTDECPDDGQYFIQAEETVYYRSPKENTQLHLQIARTGDISLVEKTTVHGQVFSQNNQPLPDTRVTIKSLNRCAPYEATTRTDTNGKYILSTVPAGVSLEILAVKPGLVAQVIEATAKSNKQGDPAVNQFDFGGSANPDKALK